MFVYSGQCNVCPDLCSHHDYWIFKVRINEWIHFFQWVFQITMILIWSSPLGETMSIVSRSYFLTQLILTFCDRVEKNCEVIKDDENLTRTEEKCQFPFKFKVDMWPKIKHSLINLFIYWGKRVWSVHLHRRQEVSEVLVDFFLSKLEATY